MIWLVILLGLILRLISLNQSFWLDEATSAVLARDFSFSDIITKFSPGDFHPPLYYLLLKLWSFIFGTSEVGLRSLSVATGLASIYILYLIADRLFKRNTALVAAGLLATSGLHIYFSQEARMYVLASFFVLLTIFFFVKTFDSNRVEYWVGFSLFLTLSVFTHYVTIFMIPVFLINGVLERKNISWWKKFIMSHIILIIGWLFWLPFFVNQINVGLKVKMSSPIWWGALGKSNLKEALLLPIKFMLGRISFESDPVYVLVIFISAMVFGFLLFKSIKTVRDNFLIWLWLCLPLLVGLLIGIKVSIFSYFRFLYILPSFYLLVAIGIIKSKKSLRTIFLVLVLLINVSTTFYYLINSRFHRENWRGLVSYLRQSADGGKSLVVFPANSQMEAFGYYDPGGIVKLSDSNGLSTNYDIIWLMRYAQPIVDSGDKTRSKIEELGYKKIEEKDFNGVVVWKYKQSL